MIIYFFKRLVLFPRFLMYIFYDLYNSLYFRSYMLFNGWGIHLFTGKFGQGKTSLMVIKAYNLCKQFPQLSILTNIKIMNFPEYTRIYQLNTAQDIINAPCNCLVLIDEIGTIFNSRDFSGGKNAVPKPLFQHLCQCRKRRMMIYATVQRFNLLDKQIRDITATVTSCSTSFSHPYSRLVVGRCYDIEEFEAYSDNRSYIPLIDHTDVFVQSNRYRQLYDTSELILGMLKKDYISDDEILANRGELSSDTTPLDKKQTRRIRRNRV